MYAIRKADFSFGQIFKKQRQVSSTGVLLEVNLPVHLSNKWVFLRFLTHSKKYGTNTLNLKIFEINKTYHTLKPKNKTKRGN